MKRLIFLLAFLLALPLVGAAQGISQLQQFTSISSPASAITQTVFGKAFRLTGQGSGCAQFSSNGTLTSTNVACGAGSSLFGKTWELISGFFQPTSTLPVLLPSTLQVNGTSTLSTTTISNLNGVIVVDGIRFAKTDAGVRAAISQCGANNIGRVYLPTGNYAMVNTPVVPSNCMLTGDGTSTVLNLPANKSVSFDGVSNSGLQSVHVDCGGQVAGNICVDIKNSSNIDIDHSLVTNAQGFGIFIHSDGTQTTSNIRITNNHLTALGNNDLIGGGPADSTGLNSVSGVLVDGNFLSQTLANGSTYEFAFDIVAARHVTFTNNFTYGKVAFGFEQTQNFQDEFSNNDFNPAINGTSFILSLSQARPLQ